MSDLNLDLNIINYNIKELEDILNLNSSHKFIDIDESAGQQFAHLYGVQLLLHKTWEWIISVPFHLLQEECFWGL